MTKVSTGSYGKLRGRAIPTPSGASTIVKTKDYSCAKKRERSLQAEEAVFTGPKVKRDHEDSVWKKLPKVRLKR